MQNMEVGDITTGKKKKTGKEKEKVSTSPVVGLKVINTIAGWGARKSPPSEKNKGKKGATQQTPKHRSKHLHGTSHP